MTLGAAAAMLGLLGFNVRCVCYSECPSKRDCLLFEEAFQCLGLHGVVVCSKITKLSEDTAAQKGNIHALTESLLQEKMPQPPHNHLSSGQSMSQCGGHKELHDKHSCKEGMGSTTTNDLFPANALSECQLFQ